jgi:hypothetical protein
MPKIISLAARKELVARHSRAAQIGLITINPVEGEPVYLCTDPIERLSVNPLRYGLTVGERVYEHMAIRLVLPDSNKDALPATSLEMDNIDVALVQATHTTIYRATLSLVVVVSTAPSDVIERWPDMEITEAAFDDDVVTLVVGYESAANEPLVKHGMTVNLLPALRRTA